MPRRRAAQSRGISDQWLQYVRGVVTETGANTFTQTTINMPVVVGQGYVVQMHSLEWQLPTPAVGEVSATDDELSYYCQLTKSSKSAAIDLDDPDLIAAFQRQHLGPSARTAEKSPVMVTIRNGQLVTVYDPPILLPFEQIFFAAVGTGEAAARAYRFRMGITTLKLSTTQIVELVQAVI